MKRLYLKSIIAGATLIALSTFGSTAQAAGNALSLGGKTTQTSGTFSVAVYTNSTETINYAEARLTFSAAVQGITTSYNGSFVGQPCGTNCVGGYIPAGATVTGTKLLATVRFTIASPGAVTVGFAGGSYFAHPVPGSASQAISVSGTPVRYTYNKPATPASTPSTPDEPTTDTPQQPRSNTSTNNDTPTAVLDTNDDQPKDETPEVVATEETADEDVDTTTTTRKISAKWLLLPVAIALLLLGLAGAYKLGAQSAAAAATQKPASRKKTGPKKKPTARTTKK